MPVLRLPRTGRILAVPATVVLLAGLALPGVAAADDGPSSGDTVVGTVVQAWAEHQDPAEAAQHAGDSLLTWIEPRDGDAVRVPTADLADELHRIPVGATVEVTVGDQVRDPAAAAQDLDPARDVLDASVVAAAQPPIAATTTITDTVTVVMMAPRGTVPDGRTLSDVVTAVNGPVADFWREQSDGAIEIQASPTAQYDWFQGTVDCSDPYALWDEAAAHAHWTRASGQHLLVYVPRNAPGCAYGLAEVGTGLGFGGRLYVQDTITSVIAHELGHNFGLGHSSMRQCDGAVDIGSCWTNAYYDYYDVMGISWSQVGSLNVAQAARIHLLGPAQQQTVSWPGTPTTVTLAPVSGRSGVRGVKLVGADGTVDWLEYRPATARDSWISSTVLQSGVLLRQAGSGGDTSLLLDGTPRSRSKWDGDYQDALPGGTGVTVAGGSFVVTVTGITAGAATVSVVPTTGDPACARRSSALMTGVALLDSASGPGAVVEGTDHGLWYRPLNGAWQSLGGWVQYGPAAVSDGTTSYVFAVGSGGDLFYRSDSGLGWSRWMPLGGYLTSGPAAASLGPGHVRVFARGAGGDLWSRELSPGTTTWSSWTPLGGYLTAPPTATADSAQSTVVVRVRGLDGAVYEQSLADGAGATAYQRVGVIACSALALDPRVAAGDPTRGAYVDSRGAPAVLQGSQVTSFGGALTSTPAVSFSGGGYLVAGRGTDNALWIYDGRTGGSGWRSLGGAVG